MSNPYDSRYSDKEYAYGTQPNVYLREKLGELIPRKILFPAEGEGRNAVYAASLGWDVDAFDQSEVGRTKAMLLAAEKGQQLNYTVADASSIYWKDHTFDALALIYAHFPGNIKSEIHQKLCSSLKPGAHVIFEAFSKNHLAYRERDSRVGGPTDLTMLFSVEEIRHDFSAFDFIQLEEAEIELHEGLYHNGVGSVIRFFGRKK